MKKLKLNKINLVALSSEELGSINGAGEKRSDRLNGGCAYSRKHGTDDNDCGNPAGCNAKPSSIASEVASSVQVSDVFFSAG
jgi:hypothetical protein